jgi:hypothetical protein
MSGEQDEPPHAALPPGLLSFCGGFTPVGFGAFEGAAMFGAGPFLSRLDADADAEVDPRSSSFFPFSLSPSGGVGAGAPGAASAVGVADTVAAGGAAAPAGSARTAPLLHASIELAAPSVSAARSAS